MSVKLEKHREIFEICQKYFMKYFMAKNFIKFYITNYMYWFAIVSIALCCTVFKLFDVE